MKRVRVRIVLRAVVVAAVTAAAVVVVAAATAAAVVVAGLVAAVAAAATAVVVEAAVAVVPVAVAVAVGNAAVATKRQTPSRRILQRGPESPPGRVCFLMLGGATFLKHVLKNRGIEGMSRKTFWQML